MHNSSKPLVFISGVRLVLCCVLLLCSSTTTRGQASTAVPVQNVIQLDAQAATIHGNRARFMQLEGIGNICYWTEPGDWVEWTFEAGAAGSYVAELKYSCDVNSEGSTFDVRLGGETLACRIADNTPSWYDYSTVSLGRVTLNRTGSHTLQLRPTHKPGLAVMNLVWIRLIPAGAYDAYRAQEARKGGTDKRLFLTPNFHPASCGWLTDFSTERNYCAYSYLAHLDRAADDPTYAFGLSEVNNIMAIMAFEPERIEELKQRMREGRAELVNAFFLEPTINLSGGEALVKMGVEGLRWQQQVMGVRPRLAWMIDVTGVHEQMAQIVAGLGLDGIIYTRDNPTGRTLHWFESADGTRTLAIQPGHYADMGAVFAAAEPLKSGDLNALKTLAREKCRRMPPGLPAFVLAGQGDYSLPPRYARYPREFLKQWKQLETGYDIQFTVPGAFLDVALPLIREDGRELAVSRSGARLSWTSFWIQMPTVKQRYRRSEHALQSAEALATIASLKAGQVYPVQPLYHGWLQMFLNMDRNTLWGAAGGMVFDHPRSWDAQDRFNSVDAIARQTQEDALRAILGEGASLGVCNPSGWERQDPVLLSLPAGKRPAPGVCQSAGDGRVLWSTRLPPLSTAGVACDTLPVPDPQAIALPEIIETRFYRARINAGTGALSSLCLKPSGREMLAGPILLVAEQGQDFHSTARRPQRKRLGDSSTFPVNISVTKGPVATTVDVVGTFYGGGASRLTMRFHQDFPRVDFETELRDIPNATVVVVEFPLAEDIAEARRGIPYGFSHGAWATPNPALAGFADGIVAAVRWSHYQFTNGGGAAILDRGLPGRELNGRTPVLFLLNAFDTYMGYACPWLSGKGPHRASFALLAHEGDWSAAAVPQRAWEFNCPPVVINGVSPVPARSWIKSSANVVVQAVRREGADLEIRLAENLGRAGVCELRVDLPHAGAALTDLVGGRQTRIQGGPVYRFPVRPQQIVTVRFKTDNAVAEVEPLLKWDPLVPPHKLPALRRRLRGRKGHPPQGPDLPGERLPVLPDAAGESYTLDRPVDVSNVYRQMPSHGGMMAVDADPNTRWATDDTISEATLDVDLGEARRIGRAYLSEAYDRTRAFELQMRGADGEWKTFARGGKIGANLDMTFDPVTARHVRLNVTDGPGGPTIWEFMLFAPE